MKNQKNCKLGSFPLSVLLLKYDKPIGGKW